MPKTPKGVPVKSWFYDKASKSLSSCLFLATVISACKTPQTSTDDSGVKIVGGTDVDDKQVEATVAILTGCTGTFVTLDDYPVKNYVLTTTQCANELTSKDQRGMSNREAVIKEIDPAKDLNHTLGLIDYAWLKNPKTGKAPERRPARINFDPNSIQKDSQIQIVGYGCQDINQPNTDFDNSGDPQKRIGSNTIDTIDTKTGLITFKGPKSNAPNNKATICPRNNMPKQETADEGAPVIWNNRVGAITLYSKVVGNEIVTTAKLLSYPTTGAFLKKWLGQDKGTGQATAAEFPNVPKDDIWYTSTQSDGGRNEESVGSNAEWAPWHRKVTCFQNQVAFGIFAYSDQGAMLGCRSKDNPGKWLDQKVVALHNSGDTRTGRYQGDWAPKERKFECPFDYFVTGVSFKNASPIGVTNILCAKTAASSNYLDAHCRSLPTGQNRALCGAEEYIGGVSVNWWSAAANVTTGANHIGYVLCCKMR
jgi:hypothetical protein